MAKKLVCTGPQWDIDGMGKSCQRYVIEEDGEVVLAFWVKGDKLKGWGRVNETPNWEVMSLDEGLALIAKGMGITHYRLFFKNILKGRDTEEGDVMDQPLRVFGGVNGVTVDALMDVLAAGSGDDNDGRRILSGMEKKWGETRTSPSARADLLRKAIEAIGQPVPVSGGKDLTSQLRGLPQPVKDLILAACYRLGEMIEEEVIADTFKVLKEDLRGSPFGVMEILAKL